MFPNHPSLLHAAPHVIFPHDAGRGLKELDMNLDRLTGGGLEALAR